MQGMICKEASFQLLNACGLLKDHFPCTACTASNGLEQPCYVEPDAPEENVREGVLLLGKERGGGGGM